MNQNPEKANGGRAMRALVVEDDERVTSYVEDVLFSLGHEHESVTNQADAQERLAAIEFDCVLLDPHIPARAGRHSASTDCGMNLLRWIRQRSNGHGPAVIIMADQAAACVDLTRELLENGAREFIAKPFPERGRTLAQIVRNILDTGHKASATGDLTVTDAAQLLQRDLLGLSQRQATARVSKAATAGKFVTNGKKGTARRIDRVSFDAWRLQQRDRDLDAER
jgi:CheY-like chemotaxis protein